MENQGGPQRKLLAQQNLDDQLISLRTQVNNVFASIVSLIQVYESLLSEKIKTETVTESD